MQAKLTFRERPYGYLATAGDHSYVISFNSIDYDVTHYWHHNPCGQLLDHAYDFAGAAAIARKHFVTF